MTPISRGLARKMRQQLTAEEFKIWCRLKELNRRSGFNFRRQVPFRGYILDFVEHRAKVAIEIDGSQHGETPAIARDAKRDGLLRDEGYLVLRFWNREVNENLAGVVERIVRVLRERAPHPKNAAHFSTSPRGEG
ncbi:MAG TPA: DUF559 domain-containing protein [Rhizomicrobium sp.]|nr:DUF559 domain-containing protein [Rhizomicrobium sp.]